MDNNLSTKGKILIYFGLINGMIQIGMMVLQNLIPFSFETYQLMELISCSQEVLCFALYLILLILSIVFISLDKKNFENTSVHKDILIYTILYVIGLRGLAPLLLPVTTLRHTIANKKSGYSTKGDTVLLIFNIVACVLTLGGFLTIVTGVLY